MFRILFGVFVGIFFRPLLWHACVFFFSDRCLPPYRPHLSGRYRPVITKMQSAICGESLHVTEDLWWLNLLLQRYFRVLRRSHGFQERIRKRIYKLAEKGIQYRFIKSIEVEEVDIGCVAPAIKSIRVLRHEELKDILFMSAGVVDGDQYEMVKDAADDRDLGVNETYHDVFKGVVLLCDVDFRGNVCVTCKIVLVRGIHFVANVQLNRLVGQCVIRIPSYNNETRYDLTFISDPDVSFSVKSGSSGVKERFKSISVRIISNIMSTFFKHSMMYPTWISPRLPASCSNTGNIRHAVPEVNDTNFSEVIERLKHDLLTYSALDYKIIERTPKFIKRRSRVFINGNERIFRFDIPINRIHVRDLKLEQTSAFEALDEVGNLLMSTFHDWRIFRGVFENFLGMKVVKSFGDGTSIVVFHFDSASIKFVRIECEDSIIFQSFDPPAPEFIIIQVRGQILYLYQFSIRSYIKFDNYTISNIVSILEEMFDYRKRSQSRKIPAGIDRFERYRNVQMSYYDRSLCSDVDTTLSIPSESLLQQITTDPSSLYRKSIDLPVSVSKLSRILQDDSCRFQMWLKNFSVAGRAEMSASTYVTVLMANDYSVYNLVIVTTHCGECTVDASSSSGESMFGFCATGKGDVSTLTIYSRSVLPAMPLANFSFQLDLGMRMLEISDAIEQIEYEQIVWADKYAKDFTCNGKASCVELVTKTEVAAQILLFGVGKAGRIVNNVLLPPESRIRIVLTVSGASSVLRFDLKSKSSGKKISLLKFLELPDKFSGYEMYDLEITLNPESYAKFRIVKSEPSTLFWKIQTNPQVTSSLKSGDSLLELTDVGTISQAPGTAEFSFKSASRDESVLCAKFGCIIPRCSRRSI